MRYESHQVELACDRFRAVTGGGTQAFNDWLGISTNVDYDWSYRHSFWPALDVGEGLEPHRINLLLSPHYHALMKAWIARHPKALPWMK